MLGDAIGMRQEPLVGQDSCYSVYWSSMERIETIEVDVEIELVFYPIEGGCLNR